MNVNLLKSSELLVMDQYFRLGEGKWRNLGGMHFFFFWNRGWKWNLYTIKGFEEGTQICLFDMWGGGGRYKIFVQKYIKILSFPQHKYWLVLHRITCSLVRDSWSNFLVEVENVEHTCTYEHSSLILYFNSSSLPCMNCQLRKFAYDIDSILNETK